MDGELQSQRNAEGQGTNFWLVGTVEKDWRMIRNEKMAKFK